MIPFQGLVANIFTIIALIRFWQRPVPGIWWATLGIFVVELWVTSALKNSLQTNGPQHETTKSIGVLCMVVQLSLIGLGIYSFFR